MTVDAECPLFLLSMELICQIIGYNSPSSYRDVALTCTTLHRRCQPVLDQHRAAHAKYKVTSDLSPETVIDLLSDTATARVERWHVRGLEFWGSRQSWDEWRPWEPKLPGMYHLAEGTPTRSGLNTREIQRYIQTANDWWVFFGDAFDEIRQNLESGHDGFLKLLLIASCPRLHSIKFVKRGDDSHTSLQWITKAVAWSKELKKWPPGFESLRNVAVGIWTGLPSYEDADVERNPYDLAALLEIPKIESVYYSDLTEVDEALDEDDFSPVIEYDFPAGTSTVKHLFLDSPSGLPYRLRQSLFDISKTLETIIIRAQDSTGQHVDDVDCVVSQLGKNNPQTMQRLIFYNPGGLNGYRCTVYRPEELEEFETLKQLTVAASDIELDAYYQSTKDRIPTREDLCEFVFEAFPSTVEAMVIWGRSDQHIDEENTAKPSDYLDSAIAHLIESGVCENLKVVYLEDVERAHRQPEREHLLGNPIFAGRKQLAFQRTIDAGRKAGVHVCTLMNRDDGGYWRNFPARPDRFDLKTGPCGERPASWKFNALTGEWGPSCEGCGECNDCWRVYPEELWKSNAAS
ncbi:hypothetical protein FSARC_8251 [Fusarium sarcochroum]|uniref:Uncharacterized protein n=1 Tax=Fusarium sarcochroum TaxID=1208366 RepID=A0A8H4X6K1_9HYPO|nr:hypothetical protein FSARC_8251 [Fusarium sarcochroum]